MGKSSAGSRSTPSLVHETRPTMSSAPITISMNSGRLMAMEVSCIRSPRTVRARGSAPQGSRREALHLRCDDVAVAQIVEIAGSDQLALIQATQDLDCAVVLQTKLNRGALDHAVEILSGLDEGQLVAT